CLGAPMSITPGPKDLTIDELALRVRAEIQQTEISWLTALAHAMNAGDGLDALQPKVAALGVPWKRWLRENCYVAESTARLYQQLARNRDQIEAEIQRGTNLSLRAARRLIAKPKEADDAGDAREPADDPVPPSETAVSESETTKPSLSETSKTT